MISALDLRKRATEIGFEYATLLDVCDNIADELNELRDALARNNPQHIQEEIGDVLFAAVNIAYRCGVCPSESLAYSNEKFKARFDLLVKEIASRGVQQSQLSLADMHPIWREIKQKS